MVIGEGFDLQINPGLVIHNFPVPNKIGIMGNQGVDVLANLLEKISKELYRMEGFHR